MGNLFKRKNGDVESPIWQMRYRVWDFQTGNWGAFKYESTQCTDKDAAKALLRDCELREERRRAGLELTTETIRLGRALTLFLDETQVWDREVPARNKTNKHPILGIEMKGKQWWIRTIDFAADAFRFYGDVELRTLIEPGRLPAFDRWLSTKGGRKQAGVGATTRRKTLLWFKRFARWSLKRGYLAKDPFDGFEAPREEVIRRDRVLSKTEEAAFRAEYEALPLRAKVRLGLALHTGARAGEIATIRVNDVSPERGTVCRRMWKKSSSGKPKEKTVRVPSELMALIVELINESKLGSSDFLFAYGATPGQEFLRRWKMTLRGVRRTVLTRLQDRGVQLRVIQEVAGHASLATTQRYLDIGESAVSDALDLLDWGQNGAIKNAITETRQPTNDRDLPRQDLGSITQDGDGATVV